MRTLEIPLYGAVGVLEALWHLCAREAPQGNIGKLTDEDIADALGWSQDAKKLVGALVQSGWLEQSQEHRLIVHDWHDHADDAVRKYLQRSTLPFLSRNVETVPDKNRPPVPLPVPLPVPSRKPKTLARAELERVYAAYPRKVGKGAALKAITHAVRRIAPDRDVGWLEERVKRFAAECEFKEQQYIPHPATWFNQERYEDPGDDDGTEVNRAGKDKKGDPSDGDDESGEAGSGLFEALYGKTG